MAAAAAGRLDRPEPVNELVKQLILLRCRAVGAEDDATLLRDLAFVRAQCRRRGGVDEELLDVIEEIAGTCMTACDLNRYADRKNPLVFCYNLASMPLLRAHRLFDSAERLRDERLLSLVAKPGPADDLKVNFRIVLSKADGHRLRSDDAALHRALAEAVREAVASQDVSGGGVLAEAIEVDIWPEFELSITVPPPAGRSAEELQRALLAGLFSLKALRGRVSASMVVPERRGALSKVEALAVTELTSPPRLSSDRSEAIYKVCSHAAWLEQNTRDWDGAQGGAITGTAMGYKHSMDEDRVIVNRYAARMGFDGYA